MPHGFTVWLTGLSGAGKITLGHALKAAPDGRSLRVELLDGDEIRISLSRDLGFSREDRDANVRRIGYVARLLSRNGVVAIAAAISPFRALRDEGRRLHEAPFVEITSLSAHWKSWCDVTRKCYKPRLLGRFVKNSSPVSRERR